GCAGSSRTTRAPGHRRHDGPHGHEGGRRRSGTDAARAPDAPPGLTHAARGGARGARAPRGARGRHRAGDAAVDRAAPAHRPAGDSAQFVVRAVLAEHARNIFWGEARSDVVPAALPRAMEESGVSLNWVFTGDDEIRLVNAQPTYLDGRRGIELTYQDTAGHTVTYVIVPGGNLVL